MPISIQDDIRPEQGLGSNFKVDDFKDWPGRGSLLDYLRPRVALKNWDEFYGSWKLRVNLNLLMDSKREVIKSLARRFNLDPNEEAAFDQLWPLVYRAQQYAKDHKDGKIKAAIENGYSILARLALGGGTDQNTFRRVRESDDERFVIFSDHHMTAFDRFPNYFKEFNYELYLDVLRHYANTDYCVVENGDVEECLIWEPNLQDATEYNNLAPGNENGYSFPVDPDASHWDAFLDKRYDQRRDNLQAIFDAHPEYYDLVRNQLISRGKFVRLTGNHDNYMDDGRERTLRNMINSQLGMPVNDVLRIRRGGIPRYLVLHGHQFDSVCVMHSDPKPLAMTMGETFSEFLSWAFQGPDRVWTTTDTNKWTLGRHAFNNYLAKETPRSYSGDPTDNLIRNRLNKIQANPKGFVENLLGHEIAWEYFENTDGFEAFTLEVWTGEEMYKMRHMKETELVDKYVQQYHAQRQQGDSSEPAKFILGHTHEPRHRAEDKTNLGNPNANFYLNSGSAGRFENLIWAIEIDDRQEQVVSWSRQDGKLQKIVWNPVGDELRPGTTTYY